jgi:hypothetical protein
MDFINKQQTVKQLQMSQLDCRALNIAESEKHEIFTYLPKMSLIEYLCPVRGLISMWFGFSVYDLVLIFAKESKKKFLLVLVLMKCTFFISAFVKFRAIISSKVRWPTLVRSIPGQKKIKGGTICV